MGNPLGVLGGSFGSSFENVPKVNQNQNGQMTGMKQMGSAPIPMSPSMGINNQPYQPSYADTDSGPIGGIPSSVGSLGPQGLGAFLRGGFGGLNDVPPFQLPQPPKMPVGEGYNTPAPPGGGYRMPFPFMGGGNTPLPFNIGQNPLVPTNANPYNGGARQPDPYWANYPKSGGLAGMGGGSNPGPFGGGIGYRPLPDQGPQMSDSDFVNMLYQTQLGRRGNQNEIDAWGNQLGSGAMNRDQVIQGFRDSEEGQRYRPRLSPIYMASGGSAQPDEVTDALRLANQPMPSYTGGLDGWDRMRGHHDGDYVNPDRSTPDQFDSARRYNMDGDSPEVEEQMSLLRGTPLY